jgi:hypothetical protein
MTPRADVLPDDLRERAKRNGHELVTITAVELMNLELPPVRWAVPGLIPEGVTLLCGKPKLGKSWMALGIAIATATGGVALGSRHVDQGEVLYLALEDSHRRMEKRMGKLLRGGAAPPKFHLATKCPRLDEGGVEALERWLEDHADARLIVVDILKKVRPRVGGNRSVYDADYEALEELVPLAAEHGVAILVVHHLRKLDADDPLDTISGSTGLSGGVDGVLVLKRDRGRADAYLHVDGRDIEEPTELALRWDAEVAGWTIAGDAEEYRSAELRTAITRVLENNDEPMTPTEVAEALGKSANTVKQRMWTMSRDGQLLNSNGRYSVAHNLHNPITEREL